MGKVKSIVEIEIMSEQFIQAVRSGDFSAACEQILNLTEKQIDESLFLLAYDDSNFCSYAFVEFLLATQEKEFFLRLAFVIADCGINYLEGAYAVAAHHARVMYELVQPRDPTDDGGLLFLFGYPWGAVSVEEAVSVASKILEHDPANQAALLALKNASERKEDPASPIRNEREQLEQHILAGKFTQAKQLINVVSERELHAMLIYLGCEERHLCAYAFTWYLMQEKEVAELHYLAYRIVTQAYARNLTGCDATGIFHLRRAMALEPENEKYVEHFLMLHTPPLGPTPLISDDEAEMFAKQFLDRNRFNIVATNTLKKMGRYDAKYD